MGIEFKTLIDKVLLGKQKLFDEREWGSYQITGLHQIICKSTQSYETHVQKYLEVYPGKRLSLQSHKLRREYWFIVKGRAIVTLGNNESNLTETEHRAGDEIFIPKGVLHRLANPDKKNPLVIVENAFGSYIEDDITRYADDFGRA